MPFSIHPGPLIAFLNIAAGISAVAAMIARFVTLSEYAPRGKNWLAALCLSVSGYLIAIAVYHTSQSVDAAVAAHKWVDAGAIFNLVFLCGFIARQSAPRESAGPWVWGMAALAAALVAIGFAMPHGARFDLITAVDSMDFPWGERLLILRGEASLFGRVIRLLLLLPMAWIVSRLFDMFRNGERFSAALMGGGLCVIAVGVGATQLINAGKLDIVYPAGLGYLCFIVLVMIHVRRSSSDILTHIRKLSTAVEQSPAGVLLLDSDIRIVYVNDSFMHISGYSRDEVLGRHAKDLGVDRTTSRVANIVEALEQGKTRTWKGELAIQRKDGSTCTVVAVVSPITGADGSTTDYVVEVEDITEYKQAAAGMQLYTSVFENSGEANVICDAANRIIAVNAAFTRITGYTSHEVRNRNLFFLASDSLQSETYRKMWAELSSLGYCQGEILARRKDDSIFPKWLSMTLLRDAPGASTHCLYSFTDISERKAAEGRIAFLAHHDPLTGLLNRYSLQDRLEQALASARRRGQAVAVGFIDVDRFKTINDSLGHAMGDVLLIEVASRLRESLRETDIVARLGGDEFIIALTDVDDAATTAHVADKLLRRLSEPYVVEGQTLHITSSLGLALFPDDGDYGEILMRNADMAMYHAKTQGRSQAQFFDAAMNNAVVERLRIEHDLRKALDESQLELHYQPKLDSRSGRIVGFEALVRWRHPVGGLISPARFIPVAEETGTIIPLGRWVVREACRQIRVWKDAGIDGICVAVNISVRQLRSPCLLNSVAQALQEHGLSGADLELEITESAAMDDPEASITQLNALQALGVRLAIDDFGTGYSSLSYLKRLPVHTLKLDQSFVRDIESDPNDVAICAATIGLAHNLGLTVVAEGVETEAQREFLQAHGCDFLQGYLFGKPLPASEIPWTTNPP